VDKLLPTSNNALCAQTSIKQWNFLCSKKLPTEVVRRPGCHTGSFGAKKQKFGSFEKHSAQKLLFDYLALL